ncbi:MAG: GNAT family N-acetyltransferase [Anaerovoracaceae bacterium]|jgi:predicted GNAT family acetyltransferase
MEFNKDKNRIWLNDENGKEIATIDFPEEKPGVVNITNTVVDNSLRGQGIAGKLTQAAADELRADGRKAVLSCSYAVRWFDQHKEYSDVLDDPEEEARRAEEFKGEACSIRRPESR